MLRIRVSCWRRLAEHVVKSVNVGDPIFVFGRIYTREWKTEQGRAARELRGRCRDCWTRPVPRCHDLHEDQYEGPNAVIEDEEHDSRINGEVSLRGRRGRRARLGTVGRREDTAPRSRPETPDDALAILREAGLAGPEPASGDSAPGDEEDADDDLVGAGLSGGRRRRGR
jgi:single-stranded DNA-binding protein